MNIEWFAFELVGRLNKTLINPDPLHTSSVLLLQVLQWVSSLTRVTSEKSDVRVSE